MMPATINTPDTAIAATTPGSLGIGASNASMPTRKLATGLVALIAATAAGSGPLATAS
jgi:hypothetical protein